MSKKFEIPWVIARERIEDEDYNAAYDGARKHGKQLSKAEGDLMVAYDLARVLKDSLHEGDDDRCLTGATVIGEILRRLNKMRSRLDRHGTQHNNLFIAYFDLKAAGGAK